MDLATFLVAVYCTSDDALHNVLHGARLRQRGLSPPMHDCEVITMEVAGEYLGMETDSAICRYFRRHWPRSSGSKREIQTYADQAGRTALPPAMTMRSTTSGGKPFATIRVSPRAHLNRSSLPASASTRSTTSVSRRRVFHTIGVPPSVGRMLLATIGSSAKSGNALRSRAPSKRAVTMRPFNRDVVAVEAATVV